MAKVIHLAELGSTLEELPMGLDTLVGDIDSSFSGGQVQRILIARALYKEPDILLLDESTSAMDLDTEKKIIENLKRENITIISVAHREENIRQADHLIEL